MLAQDTTCHSLVIQVVQTFHEIPTVDDTGWCEPKFMLVPADQRRVLWCLETKSSTCHFKRAAAYNNLSAGFTNEGIAVQYLNFEVCQ